MVGVLTKIICSLYCMAILLKVGKWIIRLLMADVVIRAEVYRLGQK